MPVIVAPLWPSILANGSQPTPTPAQKKTLVLDQACSATGGEDKPKDLALRPRRFSSTSEVYSGPLVLARRAQVRGLGKGHSEIRYRLTKTP